MNALRISFRDLAHDIAHCRLVSRVGGNREWSAIIDYLVEKRCITDYRGNWLKALLNNPITSGERAIDGTRYVFIAVNGDIVAHYEPSMRKLVVEYKGVPPFYRDLKHEVTE